MVPGRLSRSWGWAKTAEPTASPAMPAIRKAVIVRIEHEDATAAKPITKASASRCDEAAFRRTCNQRALTPLTRVAVAGSLRSRRQVGCAK